jgi:uncharacterized protein YndB with AHSA1/START domain
MTLQAICIPDLSARPFGHTVEHEFPVPASMIFKAWTERFDLWFAAPGTLRMTGEVNAPYFFETHYNGARYPHYGRFLRLERDRLVEMTWLTGAGGTNGAETVVTVVLAPRGSGTQLILTHKGFADEGANKQHREAWPIVLDHLEQVLAREA